MWLDSIGFVLRSARVSHPLRRRRHLNDLLKEEDVRGAVALRRVASTEVSGCRMVEGLLSLGPRGGLFFAGAFTPSAGRLCGILRDFRRELLAKDRELW